MTRLDHTCWHSPTGNRTRVVWVKTTYPDQLDYRGSAPAGNQTRVSSVAGTYTITVLPAHVLDSETGNRTLGICVTGRDVTNYTISDEGRAAWLAALGAFADFLGFSKKIFSAKSFWNVPFPTSLCAAAFGMFPRPWETRPETRVRIPILMKQRRDEKKIIY